MGKSKELATLTDAGGDFGGNLNVSGIVKSISGTQQSAIYNYQNAMTIQAADSGNAMPINFYNGGTNTVAIDASGRVTMPYQPFGRATGSSSATNTFVSGTALNFFSVSVAQGGITMSGNSRWTVPVSGVYLITACIYFYPQVASHYGYAITRNGALTSGSNQWEWNGSPYSGRMDNSLNVSYITEASASDYFELQMFQSNDIYTGPTNNSFCIYLLG